MTSSMTKDSKDYWKNNVVYQSISLRNSFIPVCQIEVVAGGDCYLLNK